MRLRRNLLCAVALLVLGTMSQAASASCAASYDDHWHDAEQFEVYAWAHVEDFFSSGYCFQAAYSQWGWWEHTYHASVQITSPSQRSASNEGWQSGVSFGGGSTSTFVAILYVGDPGVYEIEWEVWIFCSVGWLIFYDSDIETEEVTTPPGPCSAFEVFLMMLEYFAYPVNLSPTCFDFANAGGTTHFSWAELNGRGPASTSPYGNLHWENGEWGIVRQSLKDGLEATRAHYGKEIVIKGGYRCPHGNAGISGAHSNSAHMHGTAADFRSAWASWNWAECQTLKESTETTTNIVTECEDYGGDASAQQPGSHLHAQW